MKLQANKKYILRNGDITPPLSFNKNCGTSYKFEADIKEKGYKTLTKASWKENGVLVHHSIRHPLDIIKEY